MEESWYFDVVDDDGDDDDYAYDDDVDGDQVNSISMIRFV